MLTQGVPETSFYTDDAKLVADILKDEWGLDMDVPDSITYLRRIDAVPYRNHRLCHIEQDLPCEHKGIKPFQGKSFQMVQRGHTHHLGEQESRSRDTQRVRIHGDDELPSEPRSVGMVHLNDRGQIGSSPCGDKVGGIRQQG